MKRITGVLVALLLIYMADGLIIDFYPQEDCIYEQDLLRNKTYYIYSKGYPNYYQSARRCRFTARIPKIRDEYPESVEITIACSDIDFLDPNRCKNMGINGISFTDWNNQSTHTERFCGFGGQLRVYKDRNRVDIDWSPDQIRNRFSCTIIAQYKAKTKPYMVLLNPKNDFHETSPEEVNCSCGYGHVPQSQTTIPYLGYEVGMNQYPFMAALVQHKGSESKVYCGASILSERYALSSAQCKFDNEREGGTLSLRVGAHNNKIEKGTNHSKTYEIDWMKEHENWSPEDKHFNDIMLIRIKDLIEFKYGIGAACLPFKADDTFYNDTEVYILGWGSNLNRKYPDILKEIRTKMTPWCHKHIEDIFTISSEQRKKVNDRRLCTHSGSWYGIQHFENACNGDTGGSLVGKVSGRNMLLGILTLPPCTGNKPDIFTRVSRYLDWILENTQDSLIYCKLQV